MQGQRAECALLGQCFERCLCVHSILWFIGYKTTTLSMLKNVNTCMDAVFMANCQASPDGNSRTLRIQILSATVTLITCRGKPCADRRDASRNVIFCTCTVNMEFAELCSVSVLASATPDLCRASAPPLHSSIDVATSGTQCTMSQCISDRMRTAASKIVSSLGSPRAEETPTEPHQTCTHYLEIVQLQNMAIQPQIRCHLRASATRATTAVPQ